MARRRSPIEQRGARQQFLTPEEERARALLAQRLRKAKLPQRIKERQLGVSARPDPPFLARVIEKITGREVRPGPVPPGGVFAGVAPGIGPGKGFSAARRLITNILNNRTKFLQKIARLSEGKASREITKFIKATLTVEKRALALGAKGATDAARQLSVALHKETQTASKIIKAISAVEKEGIKAGAKGTTGVSRQQAAALRKEVRAATSVINDAAKVKAGGPLPRGVRDPRVAPAKPPAPAKPEVTGKLPADQPAAVPGVPKLGKLRRALGIAKRVAIPTAVGTEIGSALLGVKSEEGGDFPLIPRTAGLVKRGLRFVDPNLVSPLPKEIRSAAATQIAREQERVQRKERGLLRGIVGEQTRGRVRETLLQRFERKATRLQKRLQQEEDQRRFDAIIREQEKRGARSSPGVSLLDSKNLPSLAEIASPPDERTRSQVETLVEMGQVKGATDEELQAILAEVAG